MSIRSMVEESLGYVTPEDRAKMRAWENEIEAERAQAQKGAAATMVNTGLGTAMDFGQHAVQSRMQAESINRTQSRTKRQIIETSTEDIGNEFGM